jgi:hypothetical protein
MLNIFISDTIDLTELQTKHRMKRILTIFCCIMSIQLASAQNVLSLQTTFVNDVQKVIQPTYNNMMKVMNATTGDFLATMADLNYIPDKPDNSDAYRANITMDTYTIKKEAKQVTVYYNANAGNKYPQLLKDDFITRFPNAVAKSMDDGVVAYNFDLVAGNQVLHCCMFFRISADGSGGAALVYLD